MDGGAQYVNGSTGYLTVATVNFEEITPAIIGSELITFWIGGAVILGGSLVAASIGNKIAAAGHAGAAGPKQPAKTEAGL